MAAAVNKRFLLLCILLRRRQQRRKKQQKYKKSIWVRKIFQERQWASEYYLLIEELKLYDHKFFFKQFRMLPSKFEELLSVVAPFVTKSSIRREVISPEECLCITLRYLVTGNLCNYLDSPDGERCFKSAYNPTRMEGGSILF